MIAMTISRPKNVRMRPPPAELPLPPAACWLTCSRGRLTGFFSWSAPAASADSTCHMKVVAATPPARRNRFMEDVRPALEEGGGSGCKTYIGVWARGFRGWPGVVRHATVCASDRGQRRHESVVTAERGSDSDRARRSLFPNCNQLDEVLDPVAPSHLVQPRCLRISCRWVIENAHQG